VLFRLDVVVARRRAANLPTSRVHQRFMLARMRDVILGAPGDRVPPLGVLDRADFDRVAGVLAGQKLIKARPEFSAFARGGGK
jgi:NitT/TauT family transport system substrate-binding protein